MFKKAEVFVLEARGNLYFEKSLGTHRSPTYLLPKRQPTGFSGPVGDSLGRVMITSSRAEIVALRSPPISEFATADRYLESNL